MSGGKKRSDGVLRGAATHAQPRTLPRSPRHVGGGVAPSPSDTAQAPLPIARTPDAEAGYQHGLDEGRAAGHREGLQGAQHRVDEAVRVARQEFEQVASQRLLEFNAEAASRLAQLERLLANLEASTIRRVADLESDAIALAYGAVCKLLGEQGSAGPTIAAIVQHAMAQLRGSTLLTVRMHERDLRALLGDDQGRRLQTAAPQVKWIADPGVTSGGCLVDTTAGTLDARLDTQLSALRALWAAPSDAAEPAA